MASFLKEMCEKHFPASIPTCTPEIQYVKVSQWIPRNCPAPGPTQYPDPISPFYIYIKGLAFSLHTSWPTPARIIVAAMIALISLTFLDIYLRYFYDANAVGIRITTRNRNAAVAAIKREILLYNKRYRDGAKEQFLDLIEEIDINEELPVVTPFLQREGVQDIKVACAKVGKMLRDFDAWFHWRMDEEIEYCLRLVGWDGEEKRDMKEEQRTEKSEWEVVEKDDKKIMVELTEKELKILKENEKIGKEGRYPVLFAVIYLVLVPSLAWMHAFWWFRQYWF